MAMLASVVDFSSRLFRGKSYSDPRHAAGAYAEKLAAKFLRKEGYKILYRDFQASDYGRGGQVDLVCRDGETLVFVEVKSLTTTDRIRPVDHLTSDQKRRISQAALTWLRMLDNPEVAFRFDVVEVLIGDEEIEFELIQDAFQLSQGYMSLSSLPASRARCSCS